jgi:hypothetical protein
MTNKHSTPEAGAQHPRSIDYIGDPAYWQALGEFTERFATAETMLFTYFAASAGLNSKIARTLFPRSRVEQLINFVQDIWKIAPQADDIIQRVDDALKQFKLISQMRNNMIHNASFVTSDKGRVSSNLLRALPVREFRVSPEILIDMTKDLQKIAFYIVYALSSLLDVKLPEEFPAPTAEWLFTREDPKPLRKRRDRT